MRQERGHEVVDISALVADAHYWTGHVLHPGSPRSDAAWVLSGRSALWCTHNVQLWV